MMKVKMIMLSAISFLILPMGVEADEKIKLESIQPADNQTLTDKAISEADEADPEGPVTEVEAKYVCMVNNTLFKKEQIPIEVNDKTYYGCCKMCKKKLGRSAKSRQAIDPVTGEKVDKAVAIIGAHSDGTVVYFENRDNFDKYNMN